MRRRPPRSTRTDTLFPYTTLFRSAPFRLSALGYDAVLLTVRIAQDWKVGTPFPARKLADPDGFSGIDGAFRFNSNGVAERALEVQQVNAGTFSVIDPAPTSFGKYRTAFCIPSPFPSSVWRRDAVIPPLDGRCGTRDRKSKRLNSSH